MIRQPDANFHGLLVNTLTNLLQGTLDGQVDGQGRQHIFLSCQKPGLGGPAPNYCRINWAEIP
jgi:hypothetical protein